MGGLTYKIVSATIAGGIETSCIEWTGQTDIKADEALIQRHDSSPRMLEAMSFLEDQLMDGPKRQTEIDQARKLAGHTEGTIKRARKEMNIKSHKDRFSGGWKWYTQEQFALKTEQENP